MCGIIGYIGNEEPAPILIQGLKQLEYRGYDSAGIAVISSDHTQIVKAVGPVANLEVKVSSLKLEGQCGMGHTRWATHGSVNELNCHPHQAGDITLVHNGIIENYLELKETIEKAGRHLLSETDTEVLAHLIDLEVQKGFPLLESLVAVLPKLRGSYALVVSHQKEAERLYGIASGIPLWVGKKEESVYLSSDTQGLARFTKEGFALAPGEIVCCRLGGFELFDFSGRHVTGHISLSPLSQEDSSLIGFEHYMLKEIFEQPLALLRTRENLIKSQVLYQMPFRKWDQIKIIGCGSARHAGLIGKHYFEHITKIPTTVDYASEFKECFELTTPSTLTLFISQSGETADTLSALREAKQRGLATLSITNRPLNPLSLESDFSLFTGAGPEISVASTKAFTSQVSVLLSLALEWAYQLDRIDGEVRPSHSSMLSLLPELVAQALQREKQIRFISRELQNSSLFFFLGRGVLSAIAEESALKLKEVSYCFAEAYPAGELKHGPLALIDNKSTVILLTGAGAMGNYHTDERSLFYSEKMRSTLQEVKSRGATVWSWGADNTYFRKESKYFTSLPGSNALLEPILQSVVGQLFAYHLAYLKGREIDRPRNLAKSVTVE